jgi:hypothetical protein
MENLITFSVRVARKLAATVAAAARELRAHRFEYARAVLDEIQAKHIQLRMARLSRQVARQSADAAQSMDYSSNDGLG